MEKEFVPYELALRMKHLGFNEPCFGHYQQEYHDDGMTELEPSLQMIISKQHQHAYQVCTAPLYQQAFKWFRDKYKLKSYVDTDNCYRIFGGIWDVNGYKDCVYDIDSGEYDSHEESELECLKNIIEIVESEK